MTADDYPVCTRCGIPLVRGEFERLLCCRCERLFPVEPAPADAQTPSPGGGQAEES